MTNAPASGSCHITPAAGEGFIVEGGSVYHFGNSSATPYVGALNGWTFPTNGSSGSPIYIGVDETWFSGGSFARVQLNGDDALWVSGAALPSSCVHDYSGVSLVSLGQFNIWDNFEITQVCNSYAGGGNPGYLSAGSFNFIENYYCHGWTVTASSLNLQNCMSYVFPGTQIIFDHSIIDGSDSPNYPSGNANCTGFSGPCATGQGIYDRGYIIRFSVFNMTANHGVTVDTISYHDNLVQNLEFPPTTAMSNAQHQDAIMVFSGTLQSLYNNVFRNMFASQMVYANVNAGATLNIFNNVFYNNAQNSDNCINLAAQTSGGGQVLNVYNNTFDKDTDVGGAGCQISIYGTTGGNSEGFAWSGNVNTANNHLIGYSSLASLYVSRSTGGNFTVVDGGGNIIQATATARTQGYSQSTTPVGDLSVNGSGSTIAAGVDEASLCSSFSSDSALCDGTAGGASESGGVLTYPTITPNARGATWDSEASQFSAAGPSFVASPTTIPAHHSNNIAVTLTGSSTTWTGSTAFSISGVTGATLVSKSNSASTSETLQITTGSGTGTLTITDTTDSITATISVSTATLSISPTSGAGSTTPTLTLTGTNTLWSSETASTLFGVSGGSCTGESLATPTVSSNTAASAVLTTGSTSCTITVTDNSTTATATFTVATPTLPTVTTGTAGPVTTSTVVVSASSYTCTGSCSTITSEGVCYATTTNPTTPCTSDGTATPFSSSLTGLAANTTYFYRAFAANSAGTAYGSSSSFTTPQILYVTGAGNNSTSSGNTFTFSYTATATNDAVALALFCHGASVPTSATLSASGWTITSLISPVSNGTGAATLFGAIAPNTSAATFTAEFLTGGSTPVPCTNFDAYMIAEFSGNSTAGGTTTFPAVGSSGASSGGCNQTAANITPTSVNNGVWNACYANTVLGPASPWIAGATDGTGGDLSEYQTLSGGSGVAQTPTYATSSGFYSVVGTAISPNNAPAPPTSLTGVVLRGAKVQ
jgi:hypothetical protein